MYVLDGSHFNKIKSYYGSIRMYKLRLKCKSAADTDNLPSVAKLKKFFRGGYDLGATYNFSSFSRLNPKLFNYKKTNIAFDSYIY